MPTPATAPRSTVPAWVGSRAYASDGARVGLVADVLLDGQTRAPEWVLLVLPRAHERYVLAPASGLRACADGVQLAVSRADVRSAPLSAAPPDGLAREHARTLAAHYGVRCGAGPWRGVVTPALVGAGTRLRITG